MGIRHDAEIQTLKDLTVDIVKDIKEIRDRLLSRPSWVVTGIIAFLSTLSFSALTFVFTIIHEMGGRIH